MNLAAALWHALPWWGWGGIGTVAAALALAAFLGFWPVIRGFISTAVGLVPWDRWQTWALIGAAVAIFAGRVWLDLHDQALAAAAAQHEAAAVAAERAISQKREKDANDAYAAKLGALQAYIDQRAASEKAAQEKLRAEAQAERARAKRAADELEKRRSENVTEATAGVCTVTRGMVLQFNGGAAYANGGDELAVAAASAAGGLPADAAAGISIAAYAGAVEGAQRALRACRAQVLGWQHYYSQVIDPALDAAAKVIASCTPKGASP